MKNSPPRVETRDLNTSSAEKYSVLSDSPPWTFDESNRCRIERLPAVSAKTGLSRSSIYAKIAEGSFPQQVKLGPRAVGWVRSEVDAWILSRIEASRSGASE